ncbi:Cysteine-rich membrane protein 2 [Spironucleus salmonicida]|uniref:Cysteine-rich membrane protein 2 n=1 Tax=Spironucleus salmonicida TaxID=348837 RepID=V6LPA7_9EUKA|nr:Cysteine-rich membrane protein 2 [Spironucleus salmonicida]|eukprot:EST42559.1 Cysteine-rich membrane protein 2 [Spironucleus salmonicida]
MSCPLNQTLIDGNCIANECVTASLTICSNNGKCGGISLNRCVCNTGYSGHYCQCQPGFIQIRQDGLECAQNFCKSPRGQCFGRSTCILKISLSKKEFVCDGCGSFTSNDPRQGCAGCLDGASIFGPVSSRVCVNDSCITGDTVCNGKGKCSRFGFCVCEGNFSSALSCKGCKTGFQLHNGQCIADICKTGQSECNNHGKCDMETLECRCELSYSGKTCELCSDGMIQVNGKRDCANPSCVINDTICSGNGKCGGISLNKCVCANKTNGHYCQCLEGQSQLYQDELICGANLCKSPRGSCYNRGECKIVGQELVCLSCGQYVYNDPRKGCYSCLEGSVYFGTLSNRDCRPKKCITGDTLCNNQGICQASGICACTDSNADSTSGCVECISGHHMINGKCLPSSCVYNDKECDGRGTCQGSVCVCVTYLLNEKLQCSVCNSVNALENEFCTVCRAGYEIVHGECVNTACPEGQTFNPAILGCDETQEFNQSVSSGLIAGIVIMALIVVALVGLGVYFFMKKRNDIPRRNSIVMPLRDAPIHRMNSNNSTALVTENPEYAK